MTNAFRPYKSSKLTFKRQIFYAAATIAKYVLVCIPNGVPSREKAKDLLQYASGECPSKWSAPELDGYTLQTMLFTAYYHVLGQAEAWKCDKDIKDRLSEVTELSALVDAFRSQMHHDLLLAQVNLGWSGEQIDGGAEATAYITKAITHAQTTHAQTTHAQTTHAQTTHAQTSQQNYWQKPLMPSSLNMPKKRKFEQTQEDENNDEDVPDFNTI